jgi:hypothetical protein
MTKRHPDEVILARWDVDPVRLREFAAEIRALYANSPFPPRDLLKVCDARARDGLEVVCRDDAVFVGTWVLAFLYNGVSGIRAQDRWLEFEMEGGMYTIEVPIARNGKAEAERIAALYTEMAAEEGRRARAERQAPTLNNRLLNIAEAHWIWLMLGFFFVVIPAIVLVISLLSGDPR